LEWALLNKDIKNIAVTGPYGSGKSSVIRSFAKQYPGYHYLNISSLHSKMERMTIN
jgi:cytidylate kinase